MSLGTFLLQGHTVVAITNNFAPCMSFSVLVCPSVLTMSFPAPCADSVHLPGMLTCHAVLLSLLKKSGKVFVTLFPRFPLPWPAPLRCRVFDVIKIAMSLGYVFYRDDSNTDGKTMAPFSSQKLSQKVPEALPAF
jgi:hypothetical protein